MKDSGWGVWGSFVARGMPPQLTASIKPSFGASVQQNHLSLLSSISLFLCSFPSSPIRSASISGTKSAVTGTICLPAVTLCFYSQVSASFKAV